MAFAARTWIRLLTVLTLPVAAWGCPNGLSPGRTGGQGQEGVMGPGNGSYTSPPPAGALGNPAFPSGRPYGPPPPSPLAPGQSPLPTPTPKVSPLGDPSATPVANPSPTPTPLAPSPTPPPELDPFLAPPRSVVVGTHYLRESSADSSRDEFSRQWNFGTARGIVVIQGLSVVGTFLAAPGPSGDDNATGSAVLKVTEETNPDGSVTRSVGFVAQQVQLPTGSVFMKGIRGLATDPAGERFWLVEGGRHALRLGVYSTESQSWAFLPHAGGDTPGYSDLVGPNAKFNDPWGVVVDSGGNAYVSDRGNHCIRKVTLAQVVTTLAGSPTSGLKDGDGKFAQFKSPQGLALDEQGNLYVADTGNHAIRKITPEGEVSTLAGNGEAGYQNGKGPSAQFSSPTELVVLPEKGVVVWDSGNARMRLVSFDGKVTSYAGDGQPGKTDGPGEWARFTGVAGMTYDKDSKRIYFTEPAAGNKVNGRSIRYLDPSQWVSTVAGRGRQVVPSPGASLDPNALVYGPGDLAGGAAPQTTFGSDEGASETASFNEPWGIAVTEDYHAFVADAEGHRIRLIAPDGTVTNLAGNGVAGFADGTGPAAQFNYPRGVALDRNGNLIVADQRNHRIRRVTPQGVVTTLAGTGEANFLDGPGGQAKFNNPRGVAVDLGNQVYVADTANHRIRVIAPDGRVSTYAGVGTVGNRDNEPALLAQFSSPVGVAVTHQGKVYVADYGNSLIRAILPGDPSIPPTPDPNATASVAPIDPLKLRRVITIAGTGRPGWAEGPALSDARFNDPWALATDSKGTVYVADYGNSLIRRIDTLKGEVSLLAGYVPGYPVLTTALTVPTSGLRDGPAGGAAFAAPAGLALDRRGYLWVTDSKNHRIRLIR